jgi:S-formylglutathione hydrolase FrmB
MDYMISKPGGHGALLTGLAATHETTVTFVASLSAILTRTSLSPAETWASP